MKNTLLLFSLMISLTAMSQQSVPFIEIAVNEKVEQSVTKVIYDISVESHGSQLNEALYNEYGMFSYYEYGWYEEDYEYQMLLEESPKKVTKEMREAHEQRELEREMREKEMEEFRARFKAFTIVDLEAILKENNIEYTVKERSEPYYEGDYYDDYYYEYGEYGEERDNRIVQVEIALEEVYEKLAEILESHPVNMETSDFEYESIDDTYLRTIPILTEKAKAQAEAIAKSLDKKVGKLLQCSNIYPYTPSPKLYEELYSGMRDMEYNISSRNPFDNKKTTVVEFVYRFEIVNQ